MNNKFDIISRVCLKIMFAVAFVAPFAAYAQTDSVATFSEETLPIERPTINTFEAEVGRASILDTYLTPLRYTGVNLRLGYEGMRSTGFAPEQWIRQWRVGLEYANVQNPAGNHTMHSGMIEGSWGMMRRWRNVFTDKLDPYLGFSTRLRGGALYCSHNSNNPASAKAHWSVNLSAMAVYNTHIGRLPVTLRYQAVLPVAGAFFAMEYGQSYYELSLGNTSGIVHFGWWGNRFDMENIATADLHFGKTVLRVGYRGHIETSYVHHINNRIFTHGFVIGISGEWMRLTPGKSTIPKTRVVSAMY